MGTKGHVDCPLSLLMKSKTEKRTFCNRGSFDYIRVPAVVSRPLSPPAGYDCFGEREEEERKSVPPLMHFGRRE